MSTWSLAGSTTWFPLVSLLSDTKLATGGSPDPWLLSNMGHGRQHRPSSRRTTNSDVALGTSPGLDINLVPGDKQVTNINLIFIPLAFHHSREIIPPLFLSHLSAIYFLSLIVGDSIYFLRDSLVLNYHENKIKSTKQKTIFSQFLYLIATKNSKQSRAYKIILF